MRSVLKALPTTLVLMSCTLGAYAVHIKDSNLGVLAFTVGFASIFVLFDQVLSD